jgi:hypothetical protein
VLYDDLDKLDQRWYFRQVKGALDGWRIRNVLSNACLTPTGTGDNLGVDLVIATCSNTSALAEHTWIVRKAGP